MSVHSLQCDAAHILLDICWPELKKLVIIVNWKISEFLHCLKLPVLEKLYLVFPGWYWVEETGYWSDSDISEEHVDGVNSDSSGNEDVSGGHSADEFTPQSNLIF